MFCGHLQEVVKRLLVSGDDDAERVVNVPFCPRAGQCDQAFQHADSRDENLSASQFVEQGAHQRGGLRSDDGDGNQPVTKVTAQVRRKRLIAQMSAQFIPRGMQPG